MRQVQFLLLLCIVHYSLFIAGTANAQIANPVTWSHTLEPKSPKVGETVTLTTTLKIETGWHVYGSDFDPELGPKLITASWSQGNGFTPVGTLTSVGTHHEMDEIFGGEVAFWHSKGSVRQKIKITDENPLIKGTYDAQACTNVNGRCVDVSDDFEIQVKTAKSSSEIPINTNNDFPLTTKAAPTKDLRENPTDTPTTAHQTTNQLPTKHQPNDSVTASLSAKGQEASPSIEQQTSSIESPPSSLWAFFLLAFGSGLVALLTPCVFPMIPMTVSFFTRQAGSRGQAIGQALIYGFFIIALYVLIGVLVSRLNGPEFANFLSTHWLPNLLFFTVFVVFGFSFLGYFEIVLPGSWSTATDERSEKGGIVGIFFMALTLVIVSFSCTGPIAGLILVESAGGAVAKPIVGMLGFSLAFALPFGVFAAFPQMMASLPRSGGWLNAVKVVLGFIELSLALKFLSIADQAYHWNILDREIYLALWIVILSLLGLYLLGKLRMPHDSEPKHPGIGWLPLSLAIATFTFVVYLVPGMWGAPLKALAGYLPPQSTLDFDLYTAHPSTPAGATQTTLCDSPNFADFLHLPHGLQGYFDYNQALACAKAQNKPLFIDFTGHGCVNCREMEARVWSDARILNRLRNDFIIAALYVDDKTELPQSRWYKSTYDGKEKKTIGKQNADLQITKFNNNAQPFYVILNGDGQLIAGPQTYDLNVAKFEAFLKDGSGGK